MNKFMSVVQEKWKTWNWKQILILLEFHWTYSCFAPNSRQVSVPIAGYTAKKYLKKKIKSSSCCKMHIIGSIKMKPLDHEYLIIVNWGGHTIPFPFWILGIMCVMHLRYWGQQKMFLLINQNWLREMLLKKLFHTWWDVVTLLVKTIKFKGKTLF